MSIVTNVIIATSISEDLDYLKNKFSEFKLSSVASYNLVSLDDPQLPKGWYGGSKYLEAKLFVGAFNQLDLNALILFMKKEVVWELPESVQLIVKEQNDNKFKLIDLFE